MSAPLDDRHATAFLTMLAMLFVLGFTAVFLLAGRKTWDAWAWTWLAASLTGFAGATVLLVCLLRRWYRDGAP